jgi:hypothetical protein
MKLEKKQLVLLVVLFVVGVASVVSYLFYYYDTTSVSGSYTATERYGINTSDMSRKDKKALFESWFSFIPNDFGRMLREDPSCKIAQEVVDFCNEYYDDLNEQFFSGDTLFSSGYVIYTIRF